MELTQSYGSAGRMTLVLPPDPKGFHSLRDFAGGLGHTWKMRGGEPSPVLDTLYAAAVTERLGWQTSIIDGPAEGLNELEIVQRIGVARASAMAPADVPAMVGVRVSLPTLDCDLKLANQVKAAFPHLKVIVFGNAIKHTFRDWLDSTGVDFVAYGEPDAVLPALLANVGQYESRNATLIGEAGRGETVSWKLVDHLDQLPFPAWHLLPLRKYSPDGHTSTVRYFVQTSRGCPMACTMCPYVVHQGRRWRQRSVDNVVAELKYLKQRFGARGLLIRDPNIGVDLRRLRRLCERIVAEELDFEIQIETDLERLDEDTLRLLRRAGVFKIATGVESADPNCLTGIGQNADTPKVLSQQMAYCESIGMNVFAMFMVGFPDESWSSILRTLAFARGLQARYQISVMQPYPGTEMADHLESAGLLDPGVWNGSYRRFGGKTVTMRSLHMSKREITMAWILMRAELKAIQAWRDFRARPWPGNVRSLARFVALCAIALPLHTYALVRSRHQPTDQTNTQQVDQDENKRAVRPVGHL